MAHPTARRPLLAALVALCVGTISGSVLVTQSAAASEPLSSSNIQTKDPAGDGVRDYILTFQAGAHPDLATSGVKVRKRFTESFEGALVTATATQAAKLDALPTVTVVPDRVLTAVQTTPSRYAAGTSALRHAAGTRPSKYATGACGLDRIDQRVLPLDGRYRGKRDAGSGVAVYLLDSGIDYSHSELAGRAFAGYDAFGGDGSDELGNGTSLASVVAGRSVGVAPGASVHSVKVLDGQGSGTLSGILSGIEWTTAHARRPAVVNVPIGLPPIDEIDTAIRNSIASGLTYVVEAGSDGELAGVGSPGRVSQAILVAASDCADHAWAQSNYGGAVDLYAPGVDIRTAQSGGGTVEMSGVQVAGAHVAGAAALTLSRHPRLTPAEVEKRLIQRATKGHLTDVPPNTPNRLLYVTR